jgi:hypothetical protein
VDIAAVYTTSKNLGNNSGAGSFSRDYLSTSAGLIWQVAKDWNIQGRYIYQWQQGHQQNSTASSNSVMLFVNYLWDGLQIAR